MWKDALWLMRNQALTSRGGIVFTILFYAIYGALAGLLTYEKSTMHLADGFMIFFMSATAFVFSDSYTKNPYWAKDTFTRNLSALRSLPISVSTLSASRVLQIVLISPVLTLIFFLGLYGCSPWLQDMSFGVVLGMMLCCLAYGFVGSSLMILLEWGTSGKRYLIGTGLFMFTVLLVYIIFIVITKESLLICLTDWIQSPGGWLLPLAALAVGVLAIFLMQMRLQYILRHRDLA